MTTENIIFTEAQSDHAQKVVLDLMKKRRFFLYNINNHNKGHAPDHRLNPKVFAQAIKLDDKIRAVYSKAAQNAKTAILKTERYFGVTVSDLTKKSLVKCSRYTGGLDICCVYPITEFTNFFPDSQEVLETELLSDSMREKTSDDYSPKDMRKLKASCDDTAKMLWEQLQKLKAFGDERCVLVMKTRFNSANRDNQGDFMESKVAGMQEFPHALGYLFHRHYSLQKRFLSSWITFSTSRRSHVNIDGFGMYDTENPKLNHDAGGGYDCRVYFVTVL